MVDTDIRESSDHPDVIAALSARKFEPLTPEEVARAVTLALLSSDNCANDLIELRPRGAASKKRECIFWWARGSKIDAKVFFQSFDNQLF